VAETTYWDASYPPSVLFPPPVIPVTGATGGTPGAWVPADATEIPASVAEANALGLSLGAAWTEGQYVVLDNASSTHTHWTGTAFASGNAPAPPPEPEPEAEPAAEPADPEDDEADDS
jgi:hypothetical protein